MATEGSVSIDLTLEEKKALESVDKLSKAIDRLSTNSGKSFSRMDGFVSSFAGNLAAIGASKAFDLLKDGFRFLVGDLGESADMAAEARQEISNLGLAMAQTGNYTKEALEEFTSYAESVESLTGISAEAVLQTGTYLQSVNKLTKEGLKPATQATIDFASRFNIDLSNATTLVGKAIEGNVGAFKKYGIEIKKGSTDTERLNNVIEALSVFSGTAEAKIKTFGGSLALANNSVENYRKSIGGIIVENPAVIAGLQGISKAFTFLQELVDKNKDGINSFITNGVLRLAGVFTFVTDAAIAFNEALAVIGSTGSFIQIGLFALDTALRRLGIGTQEVVKSFKELYDGDTSAQDAVIERQKKLIELNEQNTEEIKKEINQTINRTAAQNKAAKDFSNIIVNETRNAVLEQQNIQKQGTDTFLQEQNKRSLASIEAEKKTTNEILLLKEASLFSARSLQEQNDLYQRLKAEENFQFLVDNLGKEEALREVARAKEIEGVSGHQAALASLLAARTKAEQNRIFAVQKYEDLSQKQRVDNLKSTLGVISTLQSSSTREFFEIGKAAAITTATIDGYAAVQKALASAPPPFNFALAALVGVATAANVNKIANQKPPKFANGGIVGGNSLAGDQQLIRANSRETVFNLSQQKRLLSIADGNSGSGSNITDAINKLADKIANMQIVVQANGREIARLVRDEQKAGFVI